MSDLSGLARSFDTLFAPAAEPDPAQPETEAIPEASEVIAPPGEESGSVDSTDSYDEPAESLLEVPVLEASTPIELADDRVEGLDLEPDPFELESGADAGDTEIGVDADTPDQTPVDVFEAELVADGEAEPVAELVADAEAEPVAEVAAGEAGGLAVGEAAALGATASGQTSDEDEFVPTPLDLATADFVAGDASKSAEIQSLAAECVERRDLGSVARAVASITLAAGDPVDASMYSVAESIMSPHVLGRLAGDMGRERQEEKRDEYYSVCRTIGADMAEAIRADLSENTDRLARRIYCQALVEMGDDGRVVIEQMAVDENRFLVRNAISILGDAGGARAVELCTSALANPDSRVRREALRSLAKLGDPESGPIIIGLLDDPDHEVQLAAAVAAGELRVGRALKWLIAMLDETKDPDEALPLLRAVGRIADPGAVASIEKHAVASLFSRPRTDVRITAYRALNEIGTPHARRLLNKAINDRDAKVKAAVKEILHLR